jgi:enoyl-CoA hydratase/carnithine racemase
VHQICALENLMAKAREFAVALAKRPPIAVASVLKAITTGIYEDLDQGLAMEAEGAKAVAASQDAIEGFTAFFEKREPVFQGK